METILIASDHGGFILKSKLIPYLEKKGFKIKDLGAYSLEHCDYPVSASKLAHDISEKNISAESLFAKAG